MTKAEQWKFRPVFYFEVMPEGYEYGMGFYEGRPAYMQAFRKKVDAAPDAFERLVKDTAKMKEFVLYGDSYKRPMGKGDYSPAVMDWYQRKSLGLTASREIDDLLFSPELVDFGNRRFAVFSRIGGFRCGRLGKIIAYVWIPKGDSCGGIK
ncbi:DUF2461 family protein [Anaerotignum lactatifermentans]|uniref:DUF2461 family protein n=1 Tax=Anaerotignum lactatifermentans TaxID=160404 RepID=UPI00255CDD16|nr:DUF2461 family protein [Anaerotignum lactatifermentans]